jgi:hypothetical protein
MSCWCGHGPWHHHGYAYPPSVYPPPFAPPSYSIPGPPRRGRRARIEDLEGYLGELEDELARLRAELAESRHGRDSEDD